MSRNIWLSSESGSTTLVHKTLVSYTPIYRLLGTEADREVDFKKEQMIECFLDPKSWIWVIMGSSSPPSLLVGIFMTGADHNLVFCISFLSGGIGTFGRESFNSDIQHGDAIYSNVTQL